MSEQINELQQSDVSNNSPPGGDLGLRDPPSMFLAFPKLPESPPPSQQMKRESEEKGMGFTGQHNTGMNETTAHLTAGKAVSLGEHGNGMAEALRRLW